MATIQEISQGSNYQGNAALGGFAPKAIDIDNKPLQTLAAYTVMFNKNQYDQRQKDTDNKIQELAELSKYDILGARGKDKDEAIRSYQKLQDSMREYAMRGVPKSPQEKLQQEIELKTNIKEATDKIKSLNARGIKYNKLLNDINGDATTNAEEKRLFKDELDQNFNNTDWKTPISDLEKYEFEMPTLGNAAVGETTTSVTVGNQIVQQTVSFFDMQKTMDNSIAEGSGFVEFNTLPPNATEEQKKQFARRKAKGGAAKVLNDATGLLNEALQSQEYKNPDGTINTQAVLAKNKMAGNILLGIDRFNQYATEMKEDAIKGVYTTKLGKKIDLKNIISADKIFLIDKNKPLTTEQVIFIDKFLRAAPDKEAEKIIETNEDINKQKANTASRNAAVNEGQLQFDKKKWNDTQVGGQTVKNGAWTFAQSVYSDLTKLADKNGVISPDNVRKLNQEQLKYLGIESDATVGIFNPLELGAGTALELVNGEVRVLNNAKILKDGRYEGNYDNTKSTNVRNIATNRLNEELRNSGTKELNTYMGIDVSGSNTSNTSGGSTSQSGGQSNVLSGSVDKSTLVKGQSYTVNGKPYVWDGSKLKAQ
jgi:hypothetical protein